MVKNGLGALANGRSPHQPDGFLLKMFFAMKNRLNETPAYKAIHILNCVTAAHPHQ